MAETIWIPAPERIDPARCTCGAEIVWTLGNRGGKLALDRRRSKREQGILYLEPHWGYCPHRDTHARRAEVRRRRARRRCYAIACPSLLTPTMAREGHPFCLAHWRALPRDFRAWISREWRPEYATGQPSRAYIEAARNARALLSALSGSGPRPFEQRGLFGPERDVADYD